MFNPSINVKQCRVFGCTNSSCMNGRPHSCYKCGNTNSTHFSRNCPVIVKRCRVVNCAGSSCIAGNPHYCFKCGDTDSTHSSKNCPHTIGIASINIPNTNTAPLNNLVIQPTWMIEGNYSSSISVGTMTILLRENNDLKVLIAIRGEKLPTGANKLTTSGGRIDDADKQSSYDGGVIAAIRETNEEFGINVRLEDIFYQFNRGYYCNMFAFIHNFHKSMVSGPSKNHKWEIEPAQGITIYNYFQRNIRDISNVWGNLIHSVPIQVLFDNHTIMANSHMKQLYFKLSELQRNGVLDSLK